MANTYPPGFTVTVLPPAQRPTQRGLRLAMRQHGASRPKGHHVSGAPRTARSAWHSASEPTVQPTLLRALGLE